MNFEFTLIFTANFVGSLDIRVSQKVSPTEVRSPEIGKILPGSSRLWVGTLHRRPAVNRSGFCYSTGHPGSWRRS